MTLLPYLASSIPASWPVGSIRAEDLLDEPVAVPAEDYVASATGRVNLLRTQHGILVRSNMLVHPSLQCGRCLTDFELTLPLRIDEEFIPLRDFVTGDPVEADLDQFRIDERNELDLSEAIRQYEQAALPIQPICREDCAGLCPVCGQNLNERVCDCTPPKAEGAWASLAGLAERLQTEESHGSP